MATDFVTYSVYSGGFALIFGLAAVRFWYVVSDLKKQVPMQIRSLLAHKPAYIVGNIVAPKASIQNSQYSNTLCVGFIADVEQKISQFNSHFGFFAPRWTPIGNSIHVNPFLVEDKTGYIAVFASRAKFSLSQKICGHLDMFHNFIRVRRSMRWFERRFAAVQSIWICEHLIKNEDSVFIGGTTQPISYLDLQYFPTKLHPSIKYTIKGPDVVVSTTVSVSHTPFYEKCLWFCSLSCFVCIILVAIFSLLF